MCAFFSLFCVEYSLLCRIQIVEKRRLGDKTVKITQQYGIMYIVIIVRSALTRGRKWKQRCYSLFCAPTPTVKYFRLSFAIICPLSSHTLSVQAVLWSRSNFDRLRLHNTVCRDGLWQPHAGPWYLQHFVIPTRICLHRDGLWENLAGPYVLIVTLLTLSQFYPVQLSSHVFVSYRSADYLMCVWDVPRTFIIFLKPHSFLFWLGRS